MEMVLLMVDDGGHTVRVDNEEPAPYGGRESGSSFEDHDPAACRRYRENPAVGDPDGADPGSLMAVIRRGDTVRLSGREPAPAPGVTEPVSGASNPC